MKKKKVLFNQDNATVSQVNSNDGKNYMNRTFNCFSNHTILHIWPPDTTAFLQTSKLCSKKRDLAPMKKVISETVVYFEAKTCRSRKKASNC